MDGTQNFTAKTLDKMEQHPSVQAMRIGRTKPYECSYPALVEKPKITAEGVKHGETNSDK